MKSKVVWVVVGLVLCVLIMISRGNTAPAPALKPKPAVTLNPRERAIQELYNAAKAEGEVIWHAAGSVESDQPILDAFHAKYPDIKVSAFSLASSQVPPRIIIEVAAGRVSMDIASGTMEALLPLLERNLMVKYDWSKTSDVYPGNVYFDGAVLAFEDMPVVWVYNTKLVSKKDAPRTWEDLLDPKWKGSKIAVRASGSGFQGLLPQWRKDKQKVVDYLKRLSKQEVMPAARYSEIANWVATGQCQIGAPVGYEAFALIKKQGVPMAVCPIGPTARAPLACYIPKGAPHPNAAKLLLSWLVSSEGAKVTTGLGRGLVLPPGVGDYSKFLVENGIEYIRITALEDLRGVFTFQQMVMETMGFAPSK